MLRMLIADDHPIVSQRIKQLLLEEFPSAFYSVVDNTERLITESLNNEWDIIISDLMMPGGGGLHALKRIKEVKPNTPFILISVYPEEQYSSRAVSEGAEAFINKNRLGDDLISTVSRIIKKT